MPPKKKAKLNPTEPRRPTTPPYEKAAAARPQSAAPLVKFLLDETNAASEIFSRLDPASFATLTRACADLFHGFKARARENGKLDQAAFLTTVPRFKWAVENGLLQLGMGLFRHALRMNVKRAPWQCAFAFGELPASYDYYASWRKAHLESDDAVTILRRLLTDFSGAFDGRSLTREMREDMSADVAAAGSVDVIKFVATVGNSGWTDEWRDEWGNSIPMMFTYGACAQNAAAEGHLDALKYLREELSCDWCDGVVLKAAEHGHVEMMLWAINNGCECEESSKYAARAALHGRRNVLEVLRNLEYPFDELVTADAALGGHLDILKWLRSESFLLETIMETGETWGPCPWDESATANAAGEGGRDAELLRFARENGCPWDGDVYLRAQEWKRPIAFEWALKNGCPFPTEEDIKRWLSRAEYEKTPPFHRFAFVKRRDSTGAEMNPKALLDELYSHFAHDGVTTLPDMSHLHDYDPDAEA